MKILLRILALLSLAFPISSQAAALITATVTVTNTAGTTNGQTITVNSDTRTWTNSVIVPATQILTNNTAAGCATNLFNAIADAPFLNLNLAMSGSTGVTLQTTPGGPMIVSLSPGWGTVVLTTNQLTSAVAVRVPLSVEYPTNQTNIASELAQGLESSTYSVSQGAPFGSNWVNLGQAQTIPGQKTLISPIVTNAWVRNSFIDSPNLTNGINRGNAFSSPGTNAVGSGEVFGWGAAGSTGADVFGHNSSATAGAALAVGPGNVVVGNNSVGVGSGLTVNGPNGSAFGAFAGTAGQNSSAFGEGALASVDFASAFGTQAFATGTNSSAFGEGAVAAYWNSTALGQGAATTGTNQTVIGNSAGWVWVPGGFQAGSISNANFAANANFPAGSDVAFGRFALSSLANGNNAGVVVGVNVYCYLSGPTGAFTINGIAGGRNGKTIILVNRTGQNMTIAHDSGVDPTSANRIYCLTGADKTVTGNSAAILIYDSILTRWIVLSFTQ